MYELILWPFRCPVNYEFRGQQVPSCAQLMTLGLDHNAAKFTFSNIDGNFRPNLIPATFSNRQKRTHYIHPSGTELQVAHVLWPQRDVIRLAETSS